MIDTDILIALKKSLEEEHDRLVKELSSIANLSPDEKHWETKFPNFESKENYSHGQKEEEADEVEEYESRIATEHSLESRLLEVNRALERVRTSKYGICQKCGKEIGTDRLRANPAAEFHIEHLNKDI